uniref:Succinate:cytochrome c oxidoreductase subunit 3 n=1 Tax=Corallina chilensis TaxID=2582857 RepID=A0A4P8VVX9_9FLOR|nr:succinate:cytochrome c oxidoreductase subunit 3 [Corallina chilensis]QCS25449.1 succinate:cytochrome c oxidoreductase subunit 3 [Corallina chilensis]
MFRTFNRPLSPHLTIYTSQLTSTYSIWHRFTAIGLTISLVIFLSLLKFSSYPAFNFLLNYINIKMWVQNAFILNFLVIFLYHLLNGLRHISWDLNFNLSINLVYSTAKCISVILLVYLLFFVQKIVI